MTTKTNSLTSESDPSEDVPDALIEKLKDKDERELVRYANEQFEKARRQRFQFERQWYLNLAFYFGRQHAQWVNAGVTGELSRLVEPNVPPWRVRLVANRIRPIIRTELAKITKEQPQGFVIPASADDEDLAAARAGEAIYEHIIREMKYNKVLRRSSFWMLLCGTGFIKDWFDPSKSDAGGVRGVIECEPVSPFHLFVPDMQEEELENQPFVVHALAKSPEWVQRRYQKNVSPDSNAGAGVLEQKFLSALGLKNEGKHYVGVKEMWVKPNGKFPNGAVIVWAGDELLLKTDGLPYQHGEFPFTKFDHIPTGRFYADSTIPDLIPLQKEYNRTRSQIIEAKNRMSKPQLMAPRGSVDPNKITSEPGLIVFYTPGFQPPSPIPLQSIPSYVVQELDRTLQDMDDISSQHEVTKGRTPPGVTAATAISFLQEEDDTKLAATIHSIEEGTEKIGRHILSHVHQFWSAERQIRVTGDSGAFESFMFSKANIRGNTDLRIQAGSATPRSRAAKQAFITELGKLGWIPPDRALRYLDMAETGRLYEEMQLDARHAQRENIQLAAGTQVPVNTWDNHMVHVEEHNNYRKRQAFDKLDDEQKMLFEMHVQAHQMLAMQGQGQVVPPEVASVMMGAMGGGQEPQQEGGGQPPEQMTQQENFGPAQ